MADVEIDTSRLRHASLDLSVEGDMAAALLSPGPRSPRVLHPPPTAALPSVRALLEQKAVVEQLQVCMRLRLVGFDGVGCIRVYGGRGRGRAY